MLFLLFFFLLLRFVIGPENSCCKTKTNHDVAVRLFPRFRHLGGFFFFEILLALDGTFLSSDWPLISGFFFTTLNQKAPLYRKLVIFGLRITGNELFFTPQQSISMSEWSNILACGDAAGEVVAVHVLPKKRKTFARFVRMSVKLLDV